jgi:transcriptional regulator with XRE-family HTH domain
MVANAASIRLALPLLCQQEKSVNQRKLFAKRLLRLRKAANLSLDKAGEKGGLSGKYWGEIERSERSPTLETVFNMADALDVPIHALVQIEREEDEERILRKRIDNILDNSSVNQLKRPYCYLLDTIETK